MNDFAGIEHAVTSAFEKSRPVNFASIEPQVVQLEANRPSFCSSSPKKSRYRFVD
jgi:TPP-dependent indolepyruvate ferredoxin oxidoreductase alpha subunit